MLQLRIGSPSELPIAHIRYRLHDEYEPQLAGNLEEEDHPLWATERIELKSVGIDIGSSTSHLMFSRLVLRRMGAHLSSRYVVVAREITWKSDILLTPYVDPFRIDVGGLSRFLEESYRSAGVKPEAIDTGAVIITGEAARKENAKAITALFSEQAGKFVCATAGPNLEAMMAAYGSGAVHKSRELGPDKTVMLIDVGGGTSKIALIRGGLIRETAATNVGGRLVAVQNDRIVRIEEAGRLVAEDLGFQLRLGEPLKTDEKEKLAGRLADLLFETIEGRPEGRPLSALAERLMVTPVPKHDGNVDCLMFSGGVGEYVYGTEYKDYGDLGTFLGRKIMERAQRLRPRFSLETSEERIRATVIGASQYTIQVSGNTIFVSDESLLPMRSLRVLFPKIGEIAEEMTPARVESAVREAFTRFDLEEGEEPIALAFHWLVEPRYELLRCFADGLCSALKQTLKKKIPIVLVFNSDVGNAVGRLLKEELSIPSEVISVDQVHLHDFDFIDVGQVVDKAGVIPIVVKSLVFGKHAEDALKETHH